MRTRYGLLIGINRYSYGRSLSGCVNDVCDMKDFMINNLDFDKNNIKTLINLEATKKNIIDSIREKVNSLRLGDMFWFHFSGHGARFLNQKSRENVDSICPQDIPYNFGINDLITENDLKEFIFSKSLNGVSVVFSMDCCHCGNIRDVYKTGKPRYVQPVNKDLIVRENSPYYTDHDNVAFRSLQALCDVADVNMLSACRSDQSAADDCFNKKPNGAFTYYLLKELNRMKPDSRFSEIVESVENSIKENYNQNPQYYGNRNARIGNIVIESDSGLNKKQEEMQYV